MRPDRLHSFTRLGATLLTTVGIAAATAAHAGAATDHAAPPRTSAPGSTQQCGDDNRSAQTMLRFPTGTTFVLTNAGLIVLNLPAAANTVEPDWPNTGN